MDGSSDFNTSHVTVYLRRTMDRQYSSCISIHLMLRFIRYTGFPFPSLRIFQYISCYGLSSSRKTNCDSFLKFQYISCYGLSRHNQSWFKMVGISIHLMLRFISIPNGNNKIGKVFQYISCYGLSCQSIIPAFHVSVFQYISCYGLSDQQFLL